MPLVLYPFGGIVLNGFRLHFLIKMQSFLKNMIAFKERERGRCNLPQDTAKFSSFHKRELVVYNKKKV